MSETIRIRPRRTITVAVDASTTISYPPGRDYDVPAGAARAAIKAGHAVAVAGPPKPPAEKKSGEKPPRQKSGDSADKAAAGAESPQPGAGESGDEGASGSLV